MKTEQELAGAAVAIAAAGFGGPLSTSERRLVLAYMEDRRVLYP